MYRILVLSDNFLSHYAATRPRVWAEVWVRYVNKGYIKIAVWKSAALLQCHCCDTRHQTQDVPTSKSRCSQCLQNLDLLRASFRLQIKGKEKDFTRFMPIHSASLPLYISDSSLSCLLISARLNRSTTLPPCVFKNHFSVNLTSTLKLYKWSPSGVYRPKFCSRHFWSAPCVLHTRLPRRLWFNHPNNNNNNNNNKGRVLYKLTKPALCSFAHLVISILVQATS